MVKSGPVAMVGRTWTDLSQSIPFARHDPGPSLVVDPANPNHVMIGASNGHVFESFNAGTSWTDRTITSGSSYACIAFDTNSGTTTVSGTTVTAGVYIGWSAGETAIYHSTNGGVSFSAMGSSPATARSVVCGANGVVYVCDNAGGTTNAWKFAAATWTNFASGAMTATGSTWAFCAVDRLNNGHAGFITGDGKLQYTAMLAQHSMSPQRGRRSPTSQKLETSAGSSIHLMGIYQAAMHGHQILAVTTLM